MPWQRKVRPAGDLVAHLIDGDERAWADLYSQFAGRIAGYARSKGAQEPDDLVGDVFTAAAERIASFEGDEQQLRSWLFTIAHHRLTDDLRRRGRRATDATEPGALDDLPMDADSIGDTTARLDAVGALAMLDWVTDDQREVLTLRILGELTIAETAAIMDKPPGAIKALQHRGIARIQRRLEDRPYPNSLTDDDAGGV